MRPWLKFPEACKYLSVGERKLRELVKLDLPHVRLSSGMLRFHPDDLDGYMRRHIVNPPPEMNVSKPQIQKTADAIMERLS